MGQHRSVKPRYGRMALAASSATVTAVAVLGGVGVISTEAPTSALAPAAAPQSSNAAEQRATEGRQNASTAPVGVPGRDADEGQMAGAKALPADSGEGRRAVFSQSRQRVWIVDGRDRVVHTYLVSGSVHDNLDPGVYRVWSRSMHATGIEDSGTMKYFVRFARGDTGAAIGFHDIPVDEGTPLQTTDELGTATSHGCIRQATADAQRMWAFASLGTTVVVTA